MLSRKEIIESYLHKKPDLSDSDLAEFIDENTDVSVKKSTLRRDVRRVRSLLRDREKHLEPLRRKNDALKDEVEYLRRTCEKERATRKEAEKEVERLESELEEERSESSFSIKKYLP